jgi:uncharacterized protein (DUF952 family)
MMPLYHITEHKTWMRARAAGEYRAPSLDSQRFIHLSGRDQVIRVADAIYTGHAGLVLLVIDPARLKSPVRYEPPDVSIPAEHYTGELFPHLYGPLNLDAVIKVLDFPSRADGTFTLPAHDD